MQPHSRRSIHPRAWQFLLDDFGHSPSAETALVEYDTSEFGRFRVQYTHDQSDLKPNDEILFQYTVIYGPHGAHRY